jgi:hypothetical protein
VLAVAVSGSLLTFPSAVAWMIGLWLTLNTWLAARGRSAWLPLAACAAIVLVKRIDWPPSIAALAAAMLLAAIMNLRRRGIRENCARAAGGARNVIEPDSQHGGTPELPRIPRLRRRAVWASTALVWLAWGGFTWHWQTAAHAGRRMVLDTSRPVVCLGDSLTAGMSPGTSYPEILAEQVSAPVITSAGPASPRSRRSSSCRR